MPTSAGCFEDNEERHSSLSLPSFGCDLEEIALSLGREVQQIESMSPSCGCAKLENVKCGNYSWSLKGWHLVKQQAPKPIGFYIDLSLLLLITPQSRVFKVGFERCSGVCSSHIPERTAFKSPGETSPLYYLCGRGFCCLFGKVSNSDSWEVPHDAQLSRTLSGTELVLIRFASAWAIALGLQARQALALPC